MLLLRRKKAQKIYIGDDVFPINFMNLMLSMHKKETP